MLGCSFGWTLAYSGSTKNASCPPKAPIKNLDPFFLKCSLKCRRTYKFCLGNSSLSNFSKPSFDIYDVLVAIFL